VKLRDPGAGLPHAVTADCASSVFAPEVALRVTDEQGVLGGGGRNPLETHVSLPEQPGKYVVIGLRRFTAVDSAANIDSLPGVVILIDHLGEATEIPNKCLFETITNVPRGQDHRPVDHDSPGPALSHSQSEQVRAGGVEAPHRSAVSLPTHVA
jgi:hypothetical protein